MAHTRFPHVSPALARGVGTRPTLVLAAALVTAAVGATAGAARAGAQRPTPAPAPRPTPAPARPDSVRPRADTAPATAAGAVPAGTLGNPATGAAFDSLLAAFRGDVTAMPPAAAARLAEAWQARLTGSGDEQLADIAVDLGALRAALAGPTVDRAVVATLLSRLAPRVSGAAPKAGDRAAAVRALGESMDRAAARLRAGPR